MNVAGASDRFLANVEEIRDTAGDSVALDDVADIVHCLMTSIEGDISLADLKLHDERAELVKYIRAARVEIAAIQPDRIRAEQIRPALDELDAVVMATAESTETFLDVAEALETMAEEAGEEERAEIMRGLATQIYEASNFQDITGQRIAKVVTLLHTIENKLTFLADWSTGTARVAVPVARDETEDETLLTGPSLPEGANDQDDIDAILASFD